jgi:hypothetical protein
MAPKLGSIEILKFSLDPAYLMPTRHDCVCMLSSLSIVDLAVAS